MCCFLQPICCSKIIRRLASKDLHPQPIVLTDGHRSRYFLQSLAFIFGPDPFNASRPISHRVSALNPQLPSPVDGRNTNRQLEACTGILSLQSFTFPSDFLRIRNSVTYISSYTIVEHQVRILKLYWPIYFISKLVLRKTWSISHKALLQNRFGTRTDQMSTSGCIIW